MTMSAVSESQVEYASVPTRVLDQQDLSPQKEPLQVLNLNLESSLRIAVGTLSSLRDEKLAALYQPTKEVHKPELITKRTIKLPFPVQTPCMPMIVN